MFKKLPGLTQEEASSLFKKWGPNLIKDPHRVTPLKLLIRQLKGNFILYLLLVAALISFYVGESVTGITILLVSLMVVSITFFQEFRAEKAMEALKKMINSFSTVIRGSKEIEIESSKIVPGDLLVLRTGEKIPADCVLVETFNLQVNESILTGESKEVGKVVPLEGKEYIEENLLFMGTFITSGKCIAKVLHSGMNTRFGGIVNLISGTEKDLPLQDKVNKVVKRMVIVAVFFSLLTGFLMIIRAPVSPETITATLLLMIALAVSAFPEGLPVVLVSALALGASRMAKKNAIVSRMSIIETLGETTVICADKTGTITEGKMEVKKVYLDGKVIEVEDLAKVYPDLQLLLKTGVFCNDSRIEKVAIGDEFKIVGSATEGALLILAARFGIYIDDFNIERLEETPFSSERKMMSVLCKINSATSIFAKGAPEVLLEKCSSLLSDGKSVRLNKEDKEKILLQNSVFNRDSYRTLALAYKQTDGEVKNYKEDGLVFLGLVVLEDPPRKEVQEAIVECFAAGISVKMITGDHKETALAVASEIGLTGKVLEGEEINRLTDEELALIIRDIAIFARVKPEHKFRIVKILKQNGEVVTMTGDGVNDAPALKEAQIGVAMGKGGTDVARSVADLTLKDDNFATIVEAVREGRTIFNNIRKFTSYQLSCNFAELLILLIGVILAPFLGWEVPVLLALQILFMNLVTDDLPALTLALNKSASDVMKENPKKKPEILTAPIFYFTLFNGLLMGILTLIVYYISFNLLNQDTNTSRTVALLTLILLEIGGAFSFRSFRRKVLGRSLFVNIYLFYASIISIIATILIFYSPLQQAFSTVPLSLQNWVLPILITLLLIAILDLVKDFSGNKIVTKG